MTPGRAVLACAAAALVVNPAAAAPRAAMTAFSVPWDPASAQALAAQAAHVDTVAPVWISVAGPDHAVVVAPDPAGHAALAATAHRPALLPVVQNARGGSWDGAGAAALLADPVASAALIETLAGIVAQEQARGVVIDLEDLPVTAQPDLRRFVAAARQRLGRVEVAVPVGNPDWDLAALASVADRLILMAYDQHWPSGTPGPIAGVDWYAAAIRTAVRAVAPAKLAAGIAGYAYDWPPTGAAATLSVARARDIAMASSATIVTDAASGNDHFDYAAADGVHHVWIVPVSAMRAEIAVARKAGIRTVALWRLGSEDPAFWTDPSPRG